MLVKIITESIKRNPNYGIGHINMAGMKKTSFTIYGDVPPWVKDGENCHITSWSLSGYPQVTEGVILGDPETWAKMIMVGHPGCSIEIETKREIQHIPCIRQSKYLYEYEAIQVECRECGEEIDVNKIKTGYFMDSDGDEYPYDVCPCCGDVAIFEERIFQTIEDALKNKVNGSNKC